MQAARQMGSGLFYGLVSALLVVGGLSLALAESYTAPAPTPTAILPTVAQTLTPTPVGPTALPTQTPLPTSTPLPPTNCPPPSGWILISVQPYETLQDLANRFRVSPAQLAQANCLYSNNLEPGFNLYVPRLPSQPSFPVHPNVPNVSCTAPFGWVRGYVVRPGDTLFSVAAMYHTNVYELQRANCLFTTQIVPGNILWVPNVPSATPSLIVIEEFATLTPTASKTLIPTYSPTFTPLPPTPTASLTLTSTSPATQVPPTPTITAFPTSTP